MGIVAYDAIIIGMGPGGEVVASRLLDAGLKVAVAERELIGGECGYYACIPSKTLVRAPEVRSEAERVAGASSGEVDWPALRDYRDTMVRHYNDAKQVTEYERLGATVAKAAARLAGPGRVQVGGETWEAEHVVLATGSDALVPPVEGLADVPVWTNREATALHDIPRRAVVIGGSAVGVELGQFLARMGTEVVMVQRGPRLVSREDARVGELAEQALRADGIDVRLDRQVTRARRDGDDVVVTLDDGAEVRTDVIVLGAGRSPRSADLGLDTVGVDLGAHGEVPVDGQCRVREGLWAIGDVTGVAMFTHVAKYQARVVSDIILGRRDRVARYEGIPRVIFSDPEIAAVGLTGEQARAQGIDVATAEVDLPAVLSRPWTYETEPRGRLGLIADRSRGVLVGAWAVCPLAGEWIHQAALAVRAGIGVDVLLDQVAQFPTYSEGYLTALESLR